MKNYYIGIDLGGTRVKIGLISGKYVLDKRVMAANSHQGLRANLPRLKQEINAVLQKFMIAPGQLSGISMAFPGLVDPERKKILSTNQKYDDALDINLEQWVTENFHVPFFIDNDARMAAVGEWKYGAAQDSNNLVVVTIGTGIGTSAIIQGKLLRGKHFQAGCLGGHMSVNYQGDTCTCGNVGCVEAYSSTWSLKNTAKEMASFSTSLLAKEKTIDFESVFHAAEHQDPVALKIRQQCIEVWSAGIVNLIHAYDPEVVVLGGGALNNSAAILPKVKQNVHQHAWCPWGKVDLRTSTLLSDAGILGAVHCLRYNI